MSRARSGSSSVRGAKGGLLFLAVLLVVVLGSGWFLGNFERMDHTIDLPPRGEAGYNPLYALRQTLRAAGVPAESRMRADLTKQPLAPRDTLLLLGDPRAIGPIERERVLDWVWEGGHLIVRTPPVEAWERDVEVPLLEDLDVKVLERGSECLSLTIKGQDPHTEFCSGRRFTFDEVEPELAWGDLQAGYAYARLGYGEGHVDVLSDMDFLTNDGNRDGNFLGLGPARRTGGMRDVPHQRMALRILSPNYGQGTVQLIYGAKAPSLLRTLLVNGWPVWLPLLLAVLAWLWARMQRFGPLLPSPPADRRSLLEHVRASGEHLYRYGKGPLLYAAMRQAFLLRLRRRDPLAASLSGEAQAELLAQRFGLDAARITQALQTPAGNADAAFRDRISLLVHMRNRL
ncbi:MAG: DUF4350 domain-containing protein [Pseudoxanthomonas sp.]